MKFIRATLIATVVASLASVSPVGASSTNPTWQVAQAARLPAGAGGLLPGYLPALSCPSAGNCVAGGAYTDATGSVQGVVLSETAGVWGAPQTLTPPVGAGTNPYLTIFWLSCGSVGNCAAVGNYQDVNGDVRSFVASETSATWSTALKVTLPANALAAGQLSDVKSVSCASTNNCSAVGTYLDATSPFARTVAFTVVENGGVWGPARAMALPANANFNPFVTVGQITCATAGNCVAVGSYIDTNNDNRGLLVNKVNGVWTARALTAPGNASAYPLTSLSEVTCVSAGNCVAIGTYANATGDLEGLIATETRNVWGRAQAMQMPADAASSPHVFFYGFDGISCSSVGNCATGGQYRDRTGNYQGFLTNEVKGVWQAATTLTLPAGAKAGGKNGGVVALSCPSDGTCSAGAAYLDGNGNYQGLVVNEVGARWSAGQKVTLPAGAATVGVAGGIYGLVCDAGGPCTATGSYLDAGGTYQGFTIGAN